MSEGGHIAVVGTFDGVHRGHRFLLDELRSRGEAAGLSPMVVTFAAHPLSVVRPEAAPKLLTTLDERVRLLREAGAGDVVVLPFDDELRQMSAREFMAMLRDRHGVRELLIGFNHRFGRDRLGDPADYRRIGREIGVDVAQADEYRPADGVAVSSSAIRKNIMDGDVAAAARSLGRSYSVAGTVGRGKQLGRTIGFPTANVVDIDPDKILPATGVYAATVTAGGKPRRAVVNVGHRPTVDTAADAPLSIEAHIPGFAGDLYGEPVEVAFDRRIRGERRFPSLDALRSQIALDVASLADL